MIPLAFLPATESSRIMRMRAGGGKRTSLKSLQAVSESVADNDSNVATVVPLSMLDTSSRFCNHVPHNQNLNHHYTNHKRNISSENVRIIWIRNQRINRSSDTGLGLRHKLRSPIHRHLYSLLFREILNDNNLPHDDAKYHLEKRRKKKAPFNPSRVKRSDVRSRGSMAVHRQHMSSSFSMSLNGVSPSSSSEAASGNRSQIVTSEEPVVQIDCSCVKSHRVKLPIEMNDSDQMRISLQILSSRCHQRTNPVTCVIYLNLIHGIKEFMLKNSSDHVVIHDGYHSAIHAGLMIQLTTEYLRMESRTNDSDVWINGLLVVTKITDWHSWIAFYLLTFASGLSVLCIIFACFYLNATRHKEMRGNRDNSLTSSRSYSMTCRTPSSQSDLTMDPTGELLEMDNLCDKRLTDVVTGTNSCLVTQEKQHQHPKHKKNINRISSDATATATATLSLSPSSIHEAKEIV